MTKVFDSSLDPFHKIQLMYPAACATELLYFAAQWLRFALFGKKGFLKIDRDYLDRKKKEVLGSTEG